MTTIRTTCTACGLTADTRADRTVLDLPALSEDRDGQPQLVHGCPGCSAGSVTAVPWRIAAYLLAAGATTVVAPDEDDVRPSYPERRPVTAAPMTLDDLIALHAALDAPLPLS